MRKFVKVGTERATAFTGKQSRGPFCFAQPGWLVVSRVIPNYRLGELSIGRLEKLTILFIAKDLRKGEINKGRSYPGEA